LRIRVGWFENGGSVCGSGGGWWVAVEGVLVEGGGMEAGGEGR